MSESRSGRPLRILYLNHVGLMSGAEKSLLRLLEGLDRSQVEPFLAAPSGPLTDAVSDLDIECFEIAPLRPRRKSGLLRLLAMAWQGMTTGAELREIIRSKQIDLVHANSLVAALVATSRRLAVPVIWHARDLRAPATPVKQVLARVSCVIAISRAVEQWVRQFGSSAPVHLIYNALGPDDHHPSRSRAKVREAWEMAPHTPLVGNVGQLVPWKRQDLFLRAGAQVLQQVPDARMVIIGSDLFGEHREYVQGLHDLAAELGIADHVLWIDHVEDMPSALAALDVLVHTAEREPLGRVIMEAMAVGLPAVAFDEAGPAELIENEETGLLVPEADVSAIAVAAVRILTDLALAIHLHDNALTRSARFDPALHAAAVLQVYREALAKS
jgi:glycosyltransferase involved in cell wall biosynthesis